MSNSSFDSNVMDHVPKPREKYPTSQEINEYMIRESFRWTLFRQKWDMFPTRALCELQLRTFVREYRKGLELITPIEAEIEQVEDDASIAQIRKHQDKGRPVPLDEARVIARKYGWNFLDEEKAA